MQLELLETESATLLAPSLKGRRKTQQGKVGLQGNRDWEGVEGGGILRVDVDVIMEIVDYCEWVWK